MWSIGRRYTRIIPVFCLTCRYKQMNKSQTGKRGSLQKIWAEGEDTILSVTFAVLF